MRGDGTLFASEASVEAAWRVVDAIVSRPAPVAEYEPGTWGPAAARAIVASEEGWHDPKSEESLPC
jgi:glucose-6-phosphate 1-dehydrogenase